MTMLRIKTMLGFVLYLLLSQQLISQQLQITTMHSSGNPLIRNYTAKEYLAAPQNCAVLQNARGLIYVGSNEGAVLEFDGVHWRYIKTPKQTSVWSLGSDETGRVYLGAIGDFGFLAADSQHTLHFQSLLEYVKVEDRKFTVVSFTHVTPNGVYFQSRQRIFCWKNDRLKVWKPQTVFLNSFWLNGDLYVYQQQIGLMKMKDDSLQLVSGVENFSAKPVLAMLPYPTEEVHTAGHNPMLIGIAGEGLFLYNRQSLRPFPGAVNQFIRKNGINCSAVLDDSTFAIGTVEDGAVIFDSRGEIIQIINAATGLA
ncbi:MAG: hypothetical protein KDH97_09420, partial [Calditrichaeota bacterium]|nr:hypothetical protein [Calditrichota bacterium]